MTRSLLAAAFAVALMAGGAAAVHAAVPAPIAAAVADPARPADQKALDAVRKPAEVVAFAGVRPGMTVAELGSGGGYYTRILAKVVGPKGKVLAIVTKAQAARPGALDGLNAIVAANPNVQIVQVDSLPTMTLPEKVDMVWTTENYHDFHNGAGANIPGLDKAVYDALKPGGIFYVEDHSAAVGAGAEATSKLHRMDEALAKSELTAAGFKLDAESDILHNAADPRTGRNNEPARFASDRFMLRMKKS
jgi:predicted methyltransferase